MEQKILDTESNIKCAIYTFIGTSTLFFLHSTTHLMFFAVVGLVYLVIAAIINFVNLVIFLNSVSTIRTQYLQVFGTAIIMLLNIPIALFYCWLSLDIILPTHPY